MTLETIVWIISLGFITYKYDITLLNSINKMSDTYHLVLFSCFLIYCLNILYKIFFPDRKQKLRESLIWITFITTMGISCRNKLGEDIDTFHFLFFSLTILYLIYIYRSIDQKKETFIVQKIIAIILIVLKILWPTIVYFWPYGTDYPDEFDWTNWPDIYF